jgi:hypothetical protein
VGQYPNDGSIPISPARNQHVTLTSQRIAAGAKCFLQHYLHFTETFTVLQSLITAYSKG